MKNRGHIGVCLGKDRVGISALMKDHRVAFEYDDKWLKTGFSINYISLPLIKHVFKV